MSGRQGVEPLVIGIGNPFRRDDGVGLEIVRRLRQGGCGARIRESSGDVADLVAMWDGADCVIVIDAVAAGSHPGRVTRWVEAPGTLAASPSSRSTHTLGLGEAVQLARRLGALPRELIIYGIEGRDFGYGPGLSPAVQSAMAPALDAVSAELWGLASLAVPAQLTLRL